MSIYIMPGRDLDSLVQMKVLLGTSLVQMETWLVQMNTTLVQAKITEVHVFFFFSLTFNFFILLFRDVTDFNTATIRYFIYICMF